MALAGARLPLVDSLIPTPANAVRHGQQFVRLDEIASMLNGAHFQATRTNNLE
jgi:hypothetical protein